MLVSGKNKIGDRLQKIDTPAGSEPVVFHYTRATGALGIITSGELWCTSVYHMSDRQECVYARIIAQSCARELLRGEMPEHRERFVSLLGEQLQRTDHTDFFAACFSEPADLLSQWRGYAGIAGYSLGFSLQALYSVTEKSGMFVGKVLYNQSEQEALLAPILRQLVAKYDFSAELDRDQVGKVFMPTVWELAKQAVLIKHPAFSEEREWRVYSRPGNAHGCKMDFIVRNDRIVPILKMSLHNGTKTIGKQLRNDICLRTYDIGPGPDSSERFFAFSQLVQQSNVYFASGKTSAAPLR